MHTTWSSGPSPDRMEDRAQTHPACAITNPTKRLAGLLPLTQSHITQRTQRVRIQPHVSHTLISRAAVNASRRSAMDAFAQKVAVPDLPMTLPSLKAFHCPVVSCG